MKNPMLLIVILINYYSNNIYFTILYFTFIKLIFYISFFVSENFIY